MTVREILEERERTTLSPHAALAAESRGRQVEEPEDPYRTIFQRDRDRILHTKAFRRLKRKTQVFLAPLGDHYRTRLTHTLEVAQVARTVARALFLNEDLTEAIALGHDLGHTPFGHAGERGLNEAYVDGFRHAEQSLRVVDKLEKRKAGRGLNLTAEVRDGILCHSEGKVLLHGEPAEGPHTLEGRVVSVCDAIAYIAHDIDDAIRARVIEEKNLPREATSVLGSDTSQRIDRMVVGVIEGSAKGEIGLTPEIGTAMRALHAFLFQQVYPGPDIGAEIKKATRLVRILFDHFAQEPSEEILEANPADSIERRTVDFVAGMTDEYALQLCEGLLLPAPWKR